MICEFDKKSDHQISENFWVREFHCKCKHADCDITLVSIELVEGLEAMRADLKKPIHVLSGYRCQKHNADIKGAKGSKHLLGIAADIRVDGVPSYKIGYAAKRVESFRNGGIGVYDTWVHVDHRGTPARW